MLNLLKEILVIYCSPTQLKRLISVVAPKEYLIHIQQQQKYNAFLSCYYHDPLSNIQIILFD